MAVKKYISIGNRRDKNLSDVQDPRLALSNLLKTLSAGGDNTFVYTDIDAIKGLQFEKITPAILATLAGTTVKETNPISPTAPEVTVEPLITLRDKTQKIKIVSGEIPAYAGGKGLDAVFIPSTKINSSNVNSTGSDLFNLDNTEVKEPEYWEYGYFVHDSLLDPSFTNQYGGIQWTGYFSPQYYDLSPTITVATTGLLIVEYDKNEDGNWQKAYNNYAASRQVKVTQSSTGNTVQIDTGHYLRLGVGDKLSTDSNITIVNVNSSQIQLSDNLNVNNNDTLTFTKTLGTDITSGSLALPFIEPETLLKIRISYWYPNNGNQIDNKILIFTYNNASNYLPFTYMYSKKPNPPGKNEIRTFLTNAISPFNIYYGNTGTNGSNYKDIKIGKTYTNNYSPKANTSGIIKANDVTISFTQGSNIVTFSGDVSNISVGNYVVPSSSTGTSIPYKWQIKNNFNYYIMDKPATETGTRTVDVIDHIGFIDWYYATSSGSTVNISNGDTTNLQIDNIVIKNSSDTSYTRITNIVDSNSFKTSPSLSLSGSKRIFVYSDKGLIDKSKLVFCSGVFGAVLASNAAVGNSLVVVSNTGIEVGQVVQYSGYIIETLPMPTVTSISGNTIRISGTTPITQQIPKDSTVTFAPAGTDVNKEICVLPLNTAPPFLGIDTGLSTNNRGLKSSSSLTENFVVQVNQLTITANSQNITAVPTSYDYNRKVKLDANTAYYIIGKKV